MTANRPTNPWIHPRPAGQANTGGVSPWAVVAVVFGGLIVYEIAKR